MSLLDGVGLRAGWVHAAPMPDVQPRPPVQCPEPEPPAAEPVEEHPHQALRRSVVEAASLRDRALAVDELHREVREGPDPESTRRHRVKGKATVRERLDMLFDPGSFHEIQNLRRHRAEGFGLEARKPFSDGVVTGFGEVHGRLVYAFAVDARIFGGSLGEAQAEKIQRCIDRAVETGAPLVAIHDGAGARVQEGGLALAGYGGVFKRHVAASGVIPQISVVLGTCAGGAAYAPALTDFVFVVRGISHMVLTGPDVVAAVTGEELDLETLGGASMHAGTSGVASFIHDDEQTCFEDVRYLLELLPSTSHETPPQFHASDPVDRRCDELLDIVPIEAHQAYDVREVVESIVDDGDYLEVHETWAPNVVCALARISGRSVAIVANQPSVLAGVMDIDSSTKAARFVGVSDAFNVPIITLVDVPGFLPGREQEHRGIIRHGAKLLYAYCQATVPRIQVILRKAYGGAYIVMDSPSIGADLSLAWPTNEVAVMGASSAVDVVFRKEIAQASDPAERRRELVLHYQERLLHPLLSAEQGLVDQVIHPEDTRAVLASALRSLCRKRVSTIERKHGNHPT